jgi:CheY-like chemotaxis protein
MILEKVPHVLIIDDDEINNYIATKLIDKLPSKAKVTTYLNGEAGLEYLKSSLLNQFELPDIIFLDLNMPVMNGWEFLDIYENSIKPYLKKNIIINIITSSVYKNDMLKCATYSFVNRFVSKPLNTELLRELFGEIQYSTDSYS